MGIIQEGVRTVFYQVLFCVFASSTMAADPSWVLLRESDPINDGEIVLARLEEARTLNEDKRVLILRCEAQKLYAYIVWNNSLKTSDSNFKVGVDVTVRFDSRQPTTELWGISTDRQASFAPRAVELLKLLETSETLAVRAQTSYGVRMTSVFDLRTTHKISRSVRESCMIRPNSEIEQLRKDILNTLQNALDDL